MDDDNRLTTNLADPSERSDHGSMSRPIEHVTRIARVTFGSDEKARRWLERPTAALAGARPLDVLGAGPSGVQQVVDLLRRIDHGLSV